MKRVQSSVDAGLGVTRQVLSQTSELMVVAFNFERGAEGSISKHPHVQSTCAESGRFRFTQGTRTLLVEPGDCFIIPSDISHGRVCLEAGRLTDCFTPRRDDFL